MKLIELRKRSKGELQKVLEDNREKLRQLRFGLSAGKVKNVREIRNLKKEIARIMTLLTRARQSRAKDKDEATASSPKQS